MIRNEDNSENSVLLFLISPLTKPRGQIEFCKTNYLPTYSKKEKVRAQKHFPM